MLRNLIADQEIHDRAFCRRIEIDRLVHVVEWCVIPSHQPFLDHLEAVDLRIGGLDTVFYV